MHVAMLAGSEDPPCAACSRDECEFSAGVSLGQKPYAFARLGQRVCAGHRHLEEPLLRKSHESTADAVAKALAVLQNSCDPAEAVALRTPGRCDRDDAPTVVHELQ